jgi:hypothetical protein
MSLDPVREGLLGYTYLVDYLVCIILKRKSTFEFPELKPTFYNKVIRSPNLFSAVYNMKLKHPELFTKDKYIEWCIGDEAKSEKEALDKVQKMLVSVIAGSWYGLKVSSCCDRFTDEYYYNRLYKEAGICLGAQLSNVFSSIEYENR